MCGELGNGKVAEMTSPMELVFKEYPLVDPTPGAVLVKIIQTNICGSELHIWKGHHPVIRSGALGHEMIGEILNNIKDKRFICFCTSIEQAEMLGGDNAIHSKKKNCSKDLFEKHL